MALRLVAGSRGKWEFFLEAWKKSQDINDITGLHKMAAERLEVYLVDKAAAELEG